MARQARLCEGDRMKPYPPVEDLLAPTLRVAVPRAVGSPAFLRRQILHEGVAKLSPWLYKFERLEAKGCPVPFSCEEKL